MFVISIRVSFMLILKHCIYRYIDQQKIEKTQKVKYL